MEGAGTQRIFHHAEKKGMTVFISPFSPVPRSGMDANKNAQALISI